MKIDWSQLLVGLLHIALMYAGTWVIAHGHPEYVTILQAMNMSLPSPAQVAQVVQKALPNA